MKQKIVSGIIMTLLLKGMLVLAFSIQTVKTNGSWIWVRNTTTGSYGEAVVGTDNALYIARGTSFYRYRPSDSSWSVMAIPPKPDGAAFKTGTALAWDFGNCIYALYGAATDDDRGWFYRYNISENSWQELASTTFEQGEGDALTWVSIDNCIYATIGGEQRPTHFLCYNPTTNSWSDAPADPPAGMGDGASLVWKGGNFLFALRGEFDEDSPLYNFWRYSLVDNVWVAKANIPADAHDGGVGGVGDGGSLLYIGFWLANQTDYLYALSGNQAAPESPQPIPDNRFYRYTISMDIWEHMEDLPFGVGYYVGCRLGYADGYIYAWQGTPSTWASGGDDLAKYEFPTLLTPIADFDYSPSSPSVNETVIFDASDSYDPDGAIINYTWDFGDATVVTATEPIVMHGYKNAGSYDINLTVTDDDGLIDTTIKSISVKKLSSIITINIHPMVVTFGSNITVNGTLIPIRRDANVTISYKPSGVSTWSVLAGVKTNSTSNYSYIWKTNETGTYYVKASWLGDANTLPTESGTKSVTINPVDSTPPTTAHNYDGLWHCNDFTITLTVTDELSGVAETYYRINEGPTKTVSAHGQPYITFENTNNTLEYWSVDNAGLEELPHKILEEIKLDKTCPIIENLSRTPDGDVPPNQPVNITVNASDSISGLRNVTLYYTINNGTTWTSQHMSLTSKLYETTIPGQQFNTWVEFKIVAYDYAGNNATLNGTEPHCTYHVIPEFSSNIILPLFVVLSSIMLIFMRRKLLRKLKN